ncbi:MAG: FAD-binding oxidoreductase [Pseudorhodoferax sp.]
MPLALDDLAGLNRTEVHDLPIVDGRDTAARLLAHAERPLSLAGMRHSQGGHTMVEHGRLLQTVMLNQTIAVDAAAGIVAVDAGVTWSELHRVLVKHGLCPKVHQSSPHFTVGGSVSVNCHGRDPQAGPLSTTLRSLRVLCGDGQERRTVPGEDLFRAVVGGYGSCGLVLQAELEVMADQVLEQKAQLGGLPALQTCLLKLADEPPGAGGATQMFYAWLNCENHGGLAPFWEQALLVSYVETATQASRLLTEGSWGESEMLRAAWSAARLRPQARTRVWQELRNEFIPTPPRRPKPPQYRLNWMRAAVDFTGHHDANSSDILLEYFLPLDADFESRLRELGARLSPVLNILSTTVRLVRQDPSPAPYLSYCADRPMVCVAIDVAVATGPDAQGRPVPTPATRDCVNAATAYVLDQGGSYYLPYYGFATEALFRQAYAGHQQQRDAIRTYNPDRRYWNNFLEQYLR